MPILVNFPAPEPTPAPLSIRETRSLDFRSIDGARTLDWSGDEFIMSPGVTGLNVPPRELVTERVPGLEGERLREIRTGSRTVVLPFLVVSGDYDTDSHLEQLARVRAFCDYRGLDYAVEEGTFDLVAKSGRGGERTLRCSYVDGMEGAWGVEVGNGSYYSTFDTKLLAVDPYWHGEEWSTPVVVLPKVAPFLSNSLANPFPRPVSASVALGADMPVTVGGDVPSAAVIELTGPATSTHITSPQGLDVTIGAIGAGHTLLLDTGRRLRCELDGSTDWSLVGDSPQWAWLPPGDASISVEVSGATEATSARVYGTSLWETAW